MRERWRLGPMGRRLLAALLLTSFVSLAVLAVGTVVPHLVLQETHPAIVEPEWLVAATVLALLSAVGISWVVSVRMVAPLRATVAMARTFGAGDHGARVPDLGRPELVELTEALNAAAEEVDRSEQARRRLTDDIAHELRNPLTALRAGLEELRDGLVEPDPTTLAALHDQATRLGRVVEDLAQLSAAESVGLQLSIENVDLGRLVELAVAAREGSIRGAGLVLEQDLDPDVLVSGDADRLHQAVGNVLANAVLYCRPGDTVRVRVLADAGRGVVVVEDTGPGLGPEDLAHAFDRTRRGGTSLGTQGSGLGLAIVRALVVAQGGDVSLDAPASGGTVVRVALPLAAPRPDARTGPPPEGRADRGGVCDLTPERGRGRPG